MRLLREIAPQALTFRPENRLHAVRDADLAEDRS